MHPSLYLLAAAAPIVLLSLSTVEGGTEKLVRVRRDTRVKHYYLVHIKKDLSTEHVNEFVNNLELKASNDTEYKFVFRGLVDENENVFSCEMSKRVLHEVYIYII